MTDCGHERYKKGGYMTSSAALRAMDAHKIAWFGTVVKECEDCGQDIAWASVVPVKTAKEIISDRCKM